MQDTWFVCLKHGSKYSADYVNKLHNMFDRNCTLPVKFACFTEDTTGIDSNIECFPLPNLKVNGWWYKPMFFDPNLPISGTMLYCDLDVIIFNNIDKFFTYRPGNFCILRDFNRYLRKDWKKFNSSIFRLDVGMQSHVYRNFVSDPITNSRRFHGDQDWIYDQVKEDWNYYPDKWAQSYKWEMRGRPTMTKINGKRNWEKPGVPDIHPDTSVAVFHGDPNPADCIDDWPKEHWK